MFIQFIWPDKYEILPKAGCQHGYARIRASIYTIILDILDFIESIG
jgi:hypothetical protein